MTELAVVSKTLLGSSAGGMGITSSNKTIQHGGKAKCTRKATTRITLTSLPKNI